MTTSKSSNNKYQLIIGRHCLFKSPNYLPGAVKEAVSYGANALMIYLGAPQNTRRRPLTELKVPEFKKLLVENKMNINNIIVHGPYVLNMANTAREDIFS